MTLTPAAEDFSRHLGAALERISVARSRDGILIAAAKAAREVAGADGLCIVTGDIEPCLIAMADGKQAGAYLAESSLRQFIGSLREPLRMIVTRAATDLWVELSPGHRLPVSEVVTVPLGVTADPAAMAFFWRSGSAFSSDGLPSLQAIAWAASIALSGPHADQMLGHQRSQIIELQRRTRNILAIVRSIVRRSGETAQSQEDFTSHLEARISALARIQSALLTFGNAGPELEDLIRSELTAHAVRENQFAVRGPSVHLTAKAFESLALAVHELTTNALKFGALAYPGGHIDVSWSFDTAQPMPRLRLDWTESKVPIVPSSSRRGFGHELIERVLPYELHAITTIDFAQGGIRVAIDLPLNERIQNMSPPRDQKHLHANE